MHFHRRLLFLSCRRLSFLFLFPHLLTIPRSACLLYSLLNFLSYSEGLSTAKGAVLAFSYCYSKRHHLPETCHWDQWEALSSVRLLKMIIWVCLLPHLPGHKRYCLHSFCVFCCCWHYTSCTMAMKVERSKPHFNTMHFSFRSLTFKKWKCTSLFIK